MIEVIENHPRIRAEQYGIGFDLVYPFAEPTRSYPIKDGFELEVILNSKPRANRFIFKVEGSKNLTFAKQPGQGKDFSPNGAYSWTDTEAFNQSGKRIAYRPENAVDSIAVYCDKKHGKYQTGKIGHILRPEARDAVGHKVWCALDYKHGDLAVTVPWKFLNEAVYPVIVDPTLGYTTVGGSTSVDPTYVQGSIFQMSENGTATVFQLYTDSVDGNFTNGIYNSTSSIPSTLVSKTSGGAMTGSGASFKTQSIGGSLVSGNYYCLAITRDASLTSIVYDSVSHARAYFNPYTYSDGNMTDPFPSPTTDSAAEYSAYIDYTVAGAGPTLSVVANN